MIYPSILIKIYFKKIIYKFFVNSSSNFIIKYCRNLLSFLQEFLHYNLQAFLQRYSWESSSLIAGFGLSSGASRVSCRRRIKGSAWMFARSQKWRSGKCKSVTIMKSGLGMLSHFPSNLGFHDILRKFAVITKSILPKQKMILT